MVGRDQEAAWAAAGCWPDHHHTDAEYINFVAMGQTQFGQDPLRSIGEIVSADSSETTLCVTANSAAEQKPSQPKPD
jgi:hypothetical protein